MHKIQAVTLHQQVARQVREMIRKGELTEGQKLNEKYLCESMGVSRTPVREALRMLNSEGLVELIPHKGAYIRQPRSEEIRDMFEVMSVLEAVCSRLAVKRMTDEDLSRLEELHQELEKHYQNRDHQGYLEVNHVYHQLVQTLAGNKILNEVVDGLRQKILLHRQKQLYHPGRFEQSIAEHRELLEAFRRKDEALAEALMKRHLLNQCEALVAYYRNRDCADL